MSMFVPFPSLFWPFSRFGFSSRMSGETLPQSSLSSRFFDVIVLIRGFYCINTDHVHVCIILLAFLAFLKIWHFLRMSGETLRHSSLSGRFFDVIVVIRGILLY